MKKVIILAFLLLTPHAVSAQMSGMATVIAGDILTVRGVTVHLYGIVAPKVDQQCQAKNKSYPCGHVSKTALMDLLFGSSVICRLRPESKAGIREADCESGGFDVAANMVHTGWAIADPKAGKKHARRQARARKAKRGLWRGSFSLGSH